MDRLPACCLTKRFLFFLILPPLPLGMVYVQTESDIRLCNMKCPEPVGALELYKTCGGEDETLLENFCQLLFTKNHQPSRLHLNTSSGCWTLTHARKSDSCVYKVHYYGHFEYPLSSTDIRVLDPVLITNITSNSSRLGEDIAVSVHYSGEESAVSWEGERLPETYRLIDDNRTLIIPSVQRGVAERRFRVRVTNPVSEETRDYQLINYYHFLLEEEATDVLQPKGAFAGAIVGVAVLAGVTICILCQYRHKKTGSGYEEKAVSSENKSLHEEE